MLVENTAYEIAKMSIAHQTILFEEKARTKANLKYLCTADVQKFAERAKAIENLACADCATGCENAEAKIRKAAVSERCGWFHCDNKCCKDCPELLRCKNACHNLKDMIAKRKAESGRKGRR